MDEESKEEEQEEEFSLPPRPGPYPVEGHREIVRREVRAHIERELKEIDKWERFWKRQLDLLLKD